MTNQPIQKIGFGSIVTSVAAKSAEAAEMVELSNSWVISDWGMADWALAISMVGGLTFIASNLFNM